MTDLVKKFSEFLGFPVELYVEKSKEKAATDSGKNEDDIGKKVRRVMSPKSWSFTRRRKTRKRRRK